MTEGELPNLVTLAAGLCKGTAFAEFLLANENVIFSLLAGLVLVGFGALANRRSRVIPQGLQNAAEAIVGAVDDFVCGIVGPKGRRFTPFVGTLFLYILVMNLMGLVPLLKSPTSSLSTTLALALCVFFYVQYTALRELGLIGYFDHLAGNPRGFVAFTVLIPAVMFSVHVISELIRPLSLSLRLRSNIWGDDLLLSFLAGFGVKGVPLLLFSALLTLVAATVQALVFSLLTTVYFALVMGHDGEKEEVTVHKGG